MPNVGHEKSTLRGPLLAFAAAFRAGSAEIHIGLETQQPNSSACDQAPFVVLDSGFPNLCPPATCQRQRSGPQRAAFDGSDERRVVLQSDDGLSSCLRRQPGAHRTDCFDDAGVHAAVNDAVHLEVFRSNVPFCHYAVLGGLDELYAHRGTPTHVPCVQLFGDVVRRRRGGRARIRFIAHVAAILRLCLSGRPARRLRLCTGRPYTDRMGGKV